VYNLCTLCITFWGVSGVSGYVDMGYNGVMEILVLVLGHLLSYVSGILTMISKDKLDERKANKKKEERDKKYPGFRELEKASHLAATFVSDSLLPKKK